MATEPLTRQESREAAGRVAVHLRSAIAYPVDHEAIGGLLVQLDGLAEDDPWANRRALGRLREDPARTTPVHLSKEVTPNG